MERQMTILTICAHRRTRTTDKKQALIRNIGSDGDRRLSGEKLFDLS
jgi:hypothetical protein